MKDFKPYDIVIVIHENYKHYGEVISKPIPGGTIMCRMVPGDCCTCKEIRIDNLRHPQVKFRPKYIHYAIVASGSRTFPVDMLRYDVAAPVNFSVSEDYRVILDSDRSYGKLIIATATAKETKQNPFTEARWASFGWSVEVLKTLLYKKSE